MQVPLRFPQNEYLGVITDVMPIMEEVLQEFGIEYETNKHFGSTNVDFWLYKSNIIIIIDDWTLESCINARVVYKLKLTPKPKIFRFHPNFVQFGTTRMAEKIMKEVICHKMLSP